MEQRKGNNRIIWGEERLAVILSKCQELTQFQMAEYFQVKPNTFEKAVQRYRKEGHKISFPLAERQSFGEKEIQFLREQLKVMQLCRIAYAFGMRPNTLSVRIAQLRKEGVDLPQPLTKELPVGTLSVDKRGYPLVKATDGRWLSPRNVNTDYSPKSGNKKRGTPRKSAPKPPLPPQKQPIRDIGRPTKPIKEIQKYEDKPEKPGRHVYISRGVYVRDTLNRTDEQVREDYRKTIERQKEHK